MRLPDLDTLLKLLVIALIVAVVVWIFMKMFAALLGLASVAGLVYLILVFAGFLPAPAWFKRLI